MPHQLSCFKQPTLLNNKFSSRILMLLSTTATQKAADLHRREHRAKRWDLPFCAFCLVLNMKERECTIHVPLSKVNKNWQRGWAFCTLLHLNWPRICQHKRKTTVLWQNKQDPRLSYAADKALHCSIRNPRQWTDQVIVFVYRDSPTPLFLLSINPNENGSVFFWIGWDSLFHTKNSKV